MTSRGAASAERPTRLLHSAEHDPPQKQAIDPRLLSPFQRVLLATDGTLTEILKAYLGEAMQVVKLRQELLQSEGRIADLALAAHSSVMQRRILLRGKWSHKNYLYAETILVLDRLNEKLKSGVLYTQKPLGQLIIEAAVETRREILRCHTQAAGPLGRFFDVPPETILISRTYRIFAQRRAIMLITEKFPKTYFLD